MRSTNVWMFGLALAVGLVACGDPPKKGGKGNNGVVVVNNGGTNNGGTNNGASSCGNGVVDPGEACDSAIESGDGVCPNTCQTPPGTCGTFALVGDDADCSARCELEPAACGGGDECCPSGCDSTTDDECTNTCGDGIVEGPELCDVDCPTDCDDSDACTIDSLTGSPDTCNAVCTNQIVTVCTDDDGCCPAGCSTDNDSDCSGSCGDEIVDDGETCDGNCPTSCDDGNVCTLDTMSGSAANCSASCVSTTITNCAGGDGCCPAGCTGQTDSDCNCAPTTSCAALNFECGMVFDGCRDVSCGTCGANELCQNNRCVDTFGIGQACVEGGSCADCITQVQSGWDGGYCSRGCRSDSDCGPAAQCGFIDAETNGGICLLKCTTNADCTRSGYECFDKDQDGDEECAPIANGSGVAGAQCTKISDCAGGQAGTCVLESQGFYRGYCTRGCTSQSQCGSGAHCSTGFGVCADSCSSDSDCRSTGYVCYDGDEDGRNECWPGATGSRQVGGTCNGTWECAGGQYGFCFTEAGTGLPGGYCTETCGDNGNTCPGGSVCITESSSGQQFCMDSCTSSSDCRNSYACTSPGEPSSELVCWL